ncbi:MAG: uracil-DNA glycosylase [Gemmataceae bacterium]|nr:uracil-DNA glycosylase [Gemmataceae bacterium]
MELPPAWASILADEVVKSYLRDLQIFLSNERAAHQVFPSEENVFAALQHTPFDAVRVVILGQDPYHDVGQAHGLAFSVQPGVAIPASLRNIFKELRDDLGIAPPKHGCLTAWAKQGVLLLNAVLTVRAHEANSHRGQGWETFTDAIIQQLSNSSHKTIFVLWGKPAQTKKKLIDRARHTIIESAHPSPLSARTGFFESKPFSRVNSVLRENGDAEIDWAIPEALSDS